MRSAPDFGQAVRRAFGKTLRELRKERQISQEALATAAGLDRTTPSLLERGLRQPTLATLIVLARELDIEVSELLARMLDHLEKDGWDPVLLKKRPAPARTPR